jgi:hypothetical protein
MPLKVPLHGEEATRPKPDEATELWKLRQGNLFILKHIPDLNTGEGRWGDPMPQMQSYKQGFIEYQRVVCMIK